MISFFLLAGGSLVFILECLYGDLDFLRELGWIWSGWMIWVVGIRFGENREGGVGWKGYCLDVL